MRTGLLKTTVDSRLGQKLSRRDTLIGSSSRALKRDGVRMRPRLASASGRTVGFLDGTELSVDAVIWASGFALEHSWIHLPIANEDRSLRDRRGVADVPGLYFLGLSWQHTRGSALLGWVKDDAQYVARRVATRAASPVGRSLVEGARAAL